MLFSVMALELPAQRISDWLRLTEEALADQDPYGALRYMEEVMALDSARAQHNYMYAEVLRLNHRYAKSAWYYNKIWRRDQGKFYPEGGAWLATMQQQSGRYEDAKKTWRRVRDQFASDPESFWYLKAIQEMRSCDLVQLWLQEEVNFELQPLSDSTNTISSEFAGTVTPGGHLVYTALRGVSDETGRIVEDAKAYAPRLYFAEGPEWQQAKKLQLLPHSRAEANFAVNADSNKVAISVIAASGRQEVHLKEIEGANDWQRLLPQNDEDTAVYSHPSFGDINGREVLFFSSDLTGGQGQRDIWYLYLDDPNSTPINPGPPLNTQGNEITPFFRKDKQQLYFASDWHHGFGGYDLFSSELSTRGFAMPQNLKRPWNSPANDLYYSYSEVQRSGTISSNRSEAASKKGEGCCNDLWRFDEAAYQYEDTLHIQTLEELNAYLPVTLYFHNDEPNPNTWSDTTALNYFDTYYAYLDLLPQYRSEYRTGLDDDAGEEAEEAMDQFFLTKVDGGIRDLATFSPLLLQRLKLGEHIQLTIKGFASPLARTDYNVKLTSRRITSLYNYLASYEDGVFQPYLNVTAENGGKLDLVRIPFGEYIAHTLVSDNPNESDAVWSIAAAMERKIEISSVQRPPGDTLTAKLRFDSEIADLGNLPAGVEAFFRFTFQVEGKIDFNIDSLSYDSTALQLDDLEQKSFKVGTEGSIGGVVYSSTRSGKIRHSILLYGNIVEGVRELNVVLEVE